MDYMIIGVERHIMEAVEPVMFCSFIM